MTCNITIDDSKCTGCMLCKEVSFEGNYECAKNGRSTATGDETTCIDCGHCVALCPAGAISHAKLDRSDFEAIDESKRPGFEQYLAFLKMRRSRREFMDKTVPRDVIEKLLTAAVQAPSAMNAQNVHFTVITDPDVLKAISKRSVEYLSQLTKMMDNPIGNLILKKVAGDAYPSLRSMKSKFGRLADAYASGRDVVLYDAPCLIMVHTTRSDISGSENALYSAANILLGVETLGMGACVIGFVTGTCRKDRELRRLSQIPSDHEVHTSIAVGYPKLGYTCSIPKNTPRVSYI